jgi:hypothetical protein
MTRRRKKTDFIPMVLIRLSMWHQEKRKRKKEEKKVAITTVDIQISTE